MPHITPARPQGIEAYRKRIDALTAGQRRTKNLYKPYKGSALPPAYVRDTASWATGIDLTPIIAWNGTGGRHGGGMLITPRHFIIAFHFPFLQNTPVLNVTLNNEQCVRTAPAFAHVKNSDALIGYLDRAVDEDIKPARLLHPSAVPDPSKYLGTPVIYSLSSSGIYTADLATFDKAKGVTIQRSLTSPQRGKFFSPGAKFDSGSSISLVDEVGLIAVSHLTSETVGGAYYTFFDDMMGAIAVLGPEKPELVTEMR